jgi:hypothetical protein
MRDFFERLYPAGKKAMETATALHGATLELLSDGYLDFFDWAPLIVVGDWR